MDEALRNINNLNAKFKRQTEEHLAQVARANKEKVEREEKSLEYLELNANQNKQLIKLQETELTFLNAINDDTRKLVNLLKSLEEINIINGKIIEANMLEIEKRLDELIERTPPNDLQQTLLNEVKKQMVEKGVNYGVQFLITGLKALVANQAGGA
jgi:hypothetical protein